MPLKALIDGVLTPRGGRNALGVSPSAFRYPVAQGAAPHRDRVAAVDKVSVPGTLTLTAITEGGSTLANVAYFVGCAAGNRWGTTGPGTIPSSITPTASQAVRVAFASVVGAEYYDLFLSTAAAPLWVGRVTEAQRSAGGWIISTVGSVTAGSSAAGSIDIGIVGTGLATNVNPFVSNNAYTPYLGIKPFDCTGVSRVHVLAKLAVTDLRSLPTLSIVPFLQGQAGSGDWYQGAVQTVSILTAVGQSLEQDFEIDVDGASGLVVLVDTISGQGSAATIWLEAA